MLWKIIHTWKKLFIPTPTPTTPPTPSRFHLITPFVNALNKWRKYYAFLSYITWFKVFKFHGKLEKHSIVHKKFNKTFLISWAFANIEIFPIQFCFYRGKSKYKKDHFNYKIWVMQNTGWAAAKPQWTGLVDEATSSLSC